MNILKYLLDFAGRLCHPQQSTVVTFAFLFYSMAEKKPIDYFLAAQKVIAGLATDENPSQMWHALAKSARLENWQSKINYTNKSRNASPSDIARALDLDVHQLYKHHIFLSRKEAASFLRHYAKTDPGIGSSFLSTTSREKNYKIHFDQRPASRNAHNGLIFTYAEILCMVGVHNVVLEIRSHYRNTYNKDHSAVPARNT